MTHLLRIRSRRLLAEVLSLALWLLVSSAPASAGLVVISGDDADDGGHCRDSACGRLYPQMLSSAWAGSAGAKGILAVGAREGRVAATALAAWNDPANGGPGAPIDIVTGAAIATVDLMPYRILYVPSDGGSTDGGITDADLALLGRRRSDIVAFVNERGGALIALTEAQADPAFAYAWLPLPLTFATEEHADVSPTPALFALFPGISVTRASLSHRFFHTVWTGPSGFLGLDVLAVEEESGGHRPVILGGHVLRPEQCDNGIDDDGDAMVDKADPDCRLCGDGDTDVGEECDDGNRAAGDGCSPSCTREVCGNARLDPGEECDDGNRTAGDCCSAACRLEPDDSLCGDGDVCRGDLVCRAGACVAPTRLEAQACLSTHQIGVVTNFDDGSLSRIDLPTTTALAPIPVGAGPWAAAVRPGGREIFVTNREGGNVSVVDAASGALRATIPVLARPLGIAFDAPGAFAYVASYDEDTLAVVDATARTIVRTIPVGRGPSGLTLSPSGTRLYLSNYAGGTISVIDTATGAVTATLHPGKRPLQMAVDAARGRLYITNYEDATVSVFGLFGNTPVTTIRVGTNPFGIVIDAERSRAWVTNAAADTISVIDTRTDTVVGTLSTGKAPLGIGLDLRGTGLYVANAIDNSVSSFDPAGGVLSATLDVGRTPVAFGPFIGVVANTCPRAALDCDDLDPFTADTCGPPDGCRHVALQGLEAVAAGVAALRATVRTAPEGTFRGAGTAARLERFVGAAESLLAPAETSPRSRLRRIRQQLRRVIGAARRDVRRGALERDLGLRLVDVARAARRAGHGAAPLASPRLASPTLVPPPLAR